MHLSNTHYCLYKLCASYKILYMHIILLLKMKHYLLEKKTCMYIILENFKTKTCFNSYNTLMSLMSMLMQFRILYM